MEGHGAVLLLKLDLRSVRNSALRRKFYVDIS